MVWFDANRVFAAMGVVLIHSSTDFAGQPFANAATDERLLPVFLRSVGEFSGSEMFFLFSLFLMAMRVDTKMPSYSSAIGMQAKRLLIPFSFWVVFYAFFRLVKADAFDYAPYIWEQLAQPQSWLGYFVLGKVQYHMHFLPTLFALFLFYPLMRVATRYPIFGLTLFFTLGVMNSAQAFLWSLDLDAGLRDYLIRALKIFGYVGYGFAAFAIYGLWKDGIPRGESRLLRRGALYFAILAYLATLPFYGVAVKTGAWGIRDGWDFYGHFHDAVLHGWAVLGMVAKMVQACALYLWRLPRASADHRLAGYCALQIRCKRGDVALGHRLAALCTGPADVLCAGGWSITSKTRCMDYRPWANPVGSVEISQKGRR
jgi:hypothetical protein